MIQPGQKLSEGDFFIPESVEQLEEIREVSEVGFNWGKRIFLQEMIDEKRIPTYMKRFHMIIGSDNRIFGRQKYTFPDFKALCENTFGDGKG